jgi:type II secretory pathway component HofQ
LAVGAPLEEEEEEEEEEGAAAAEEELLENHEKAPLLVEGASPFDSRGAALAPPLVPAVPLEEEREAEGARLEREGL